MHEYTHEDQKRIFCLRTFSKGHSWHEPKKKMQIKCELETINEELHIDSFASRKDEIESEEQATYMQIIE